MMTAARRRPVRSAAALALASLVLCAGLVAAQEAPAPAAGQPAAAPAAPTPGAVSIRLAVVDLDRVLAKSERWADFQEELQRSQDKMQRTLEKYERELRLLRSEYDNLPPGTDLAAETRAKIESSLGEYRNVQQQLQNEIQTQRVQALSEVFNQIRDVIRKYATANQIDLVLKKQDLTVSATRPAEMGVIVATADVLFSRDVFDITEPIVTELNALYPQEIKEK